MGAPPPARTGRWDREMEVTSTGARPGAWPACGPSSTHGWLCDPSVPDMFWTKQNYLASERKISQSSPLREKQTTGHPPSHNGQGGRVSKAFCHPAGHRAPLARHRPLAGVDREPSTARASTNGEAGSAGHVSCSTINDNSLNSVGLEDGLPAVCAALQGPAWGQEAGR